MKAEIDVTQTVEVTVPNGFFTEDFMAEFRKDFYAFYSPEEHLHHLAQLYARGLIHEQSFVEGYGKVEELGFKFSVECTEHRTLQIEGA